MKTLSHYIFTVAVSFSLVVVFNIILSGNIQGTTFNNLELLGVFGICLLIGVLMSITDRIKYKTTYALMLVHIFDIFFALFFLGGFVFNIIDLTWDFIIPIGIMTIVIYFIIFAIVILRNKSDVEAINKIIQERKLNGKNN